MDNQHRKISGYRELTQDEIDAMNLFKAIEGNIKQALDELAKGTISANPRWLAIGRTHIEQGFMAIGRAIAKPEGDE